MMKAGNRARPGNGVDDKGRSICVKRVKEPHQGEWFLMGAGRLRYSRDHREVNQEYYGLTSGPGDPLWAVIERWLITASRPNVFNNAGRRFS